MLCVCVHARLESDPSMCKFKCVCLFRHVSYQARLIVSFVLLWLLHSCVPRSSYVSVEWGRENGAFDCFVSYMRVYGLGSGGFNVWSRLTVSLTCCSGCGCL